jgi:Cu2+-exporting ATPase/Cu+-exporting ATPase
MADSSKTQLCLYCHSAPARAGNPFCCKACETLYEIKFFQDQNPEPKSPPPSFNEEDALIQKHYGLKVGNEIYYSCSVERLACEACLQQLSELKTIWPYIQDLRWDRGSSTLNISLPKEAGNPSQLFQILSRMGLKPRWNNPEDSKNQNNQMRSSLLRLAITGALFGNIMLFSVPIYGGLEGSLASLFFIIQGVLFLPVVLWSAQPFYRTSLVSLKLRTLSTDLPLTLAFLIGSVISYVALFLQKTEWVYFDSLSGFLFLILLSRYLLEKSLWQTEQHHTLDRYFEKAYFLAQSGENPPTLKHLLKLKSGDILTLETNQRVPADGILLSECSDMDTSWISGEFWPQTFGKGSRIRAGSLLVSPSCRIQITEQPQDSQFVKLLSSLKPKGQKIQSGLESKIGVTLVTLSFMTAFILFMLFQNLGLEELIKRSLALWIVACPCAVSFAAPLTRATGSILAEKLGFWIRDTSVFEKLHHVKKIAFDKTGTLTDSFLNLNLNLPILDPHYKKIILSLESISHHPIAKAFRKSLGYQELYSIAQVEEISGVGVQGYINQDFYELKKSENQKNASVELKKNGHTLLNLNFEEQVHPCLVKVFQDLLKQFEIYILSGDHPDKVSKVAKTLGIPKKNVYSSLSPNEKKEIIQKIHPDLYIGDGTNDILAMQNAPLSLSFGNASFEAQTASQIIMTHSDFEKLPLLFQLSQEVKNLLHRNFGIALIYNVGAGYLAVTGRIGPLEAAILMPIASLVLLVSTQLKTSWLNRTERGLKK